MSQQQIVSYNGISK